MMENAEVKSDVIKDEKPNPEEIIYKWDDAYLDWKHYDDMKIQDNVSSMS